ncbi:MAG: FtsQ-type POTRA domain-containing protein [Bacillota bacterium]|nr:FtsQ-type POTRA domain-containing protein [Bacillota bacterium]
MKLRRIKRDSEFQLKKQKKNKKNKRIIKSIRRVFLFVLVIVSLSMFALSSFFNIKKIVVYGNSKLDSNSVISSTKIQIGSNGFKRVGNKPLNFFLFRYGNEEKSILKSFSYAKNAKVTFYMPDTVCIDIQERKPLFYIEHGGAFLLIDEDGVALEEANKPFGKTLFVKGISFKNYVIGQALKAEDNDYTQYVKKLLAEIPKNDESNKLKLMPLITQFDLSNPFKIKITLDKRITADVGDLKEIAYRLDFIRNIYFNKLKKNDKGNLEYNDDGKYNFKSN